MSNNNKSLKLSDLENEPGATALISSFKDHTDPKYTGPGTWNAIHRIAFDARTDKDQRCFIAIMHDICNKYSCMTCRGHCQEYIKNHPMEEYLGVVVEIDGKKIMLGMFIWTWKFHNAVNYRLKKPIMSWTTAYNLYNDTDNLVCSKSCLEADTNTTDNKIIAPPTINLSQPQKPFQLVSIKRK